MKFGQANGHTPSVADERLDSAKAVHDMYASLAVVNGFNNALETSFTELCDTYAELLTCDNDGSTSRLAIVQKVSALEDDCRFCLSRIKQCVEKLSIQINVELATTDKPAATERKSPS